MRFSLEAVLVSLFLFVLLGLGLFSDMPFLERLSGSRLTYMTVVAFPFVAILAMVIKKRDATASMASDWLPIFATLLVYENLKHLHANRITELLGIEPKDGLMLAADELLFGKAAPLHFDTAFFTGTFSEVMWFFYVWVYYLGPVLLLGYAYFLVNDRPLFLMMRRALMFGLLGGYIVYLLVPVAGPLFLIGEQFTHPILTQPELRRLTFSVLRYNWDCFPSLHTAIPWLLTIVAWPKLHRGARVSCLVAAIGVTASTIILRFHYGIDIIAGLLWAVLIAWLVMRPLRPRDQPAIFPNLSSLAEPLHQGQLMTRFRALILGVMFVLTGFTALLAEQSFEKLLGTLVGASTPAAATVLAVYFLGLMLGGMLYGPVLRPRSKNPIRTYAFLEAGIAVWALLLYLLHDELIAFFTPFLSLAQGSFWLLQLCRVLVAVVWILPPTILMGATFPAVVDAIESMRMKEPGRAITGFYAANLLGAFLGAVTGPYVAFPRWGVDGTLLLTYGVDAIVAVFALYLASRVILEVTPAARMTQPGLIPAFTKIPVLFLVAFLSGFLFFSLEVTWIHLISTVLGNSIYAFSAMLAIVIAGLGLGGSLVSRLFPGDRNIPSLALFFILIGGAWLVSIQHSQWPDIPHRFSVWGGSLETFVQAEALRWIQVAILLLPSAIVLGMIYPLVFRLQEFPRENRSTFAGYLGGVNSVGCVLGALLTGFVLIPLVGSEHTLKLMAASLVACALLLSRLFPRRIGRILAAGLALLVAIPVLLNPPWNRLSLTTGEHVYFQQNQVGPGTSLVFFHEDTLGGITTVVHNKPGFRGQEREYLTLLTNGKFQGNDAWEVRAQSGFALVPIMHASNSDHALVIGLGTGHSAAVVEAFGFRNIDVAEIAPGIVEAARRYFGHINGAVLDKPNVRLFLEDGRNKLLLSKQQYDLITMEISSVWFAGSTNLYSEQFYKLARKRLNRGGVFQQWIQLHHIGAVEVASTIATLRSVFPYVSFWRVGGQGILLASDAPQRINSGVFNDMAPAARELQLSEEELSGIVKDAMLSRVLSTEDVTDLVTRVALPLNTDANRYLEYATPKFNISRQNHAASNIDALLQYSTFSPHEVQGMSDHPLARWLDSLTASDFRKHYGWDVEEKEEKRIAVAGGQ